MIDRLYHYTPNTAHGRWSPRSEVSDDTIAYLTHVIQAGAQTDWLADLPDDRQRPTLPIGLGFALGYTGVMDSGAWCYHIGRYGVQLSHNWVLLTQEHADECWPQVVAVADAYEVLCDPHCPALPCLVSLLVDVTAWPPEIARLICRDTWEMLGDLERCVAWTLLK